MMYTKKDKIRIAILIGQTGWGGAERQLSFLLEYGNHEKFDYHVIVLNHRPDNMNQLLHAHGTTLWLVPESSKTIPKRLLYLYQVLSKLRPDVLYSWESHLNPYVALLGRAARISVLLGSLRNDPDQAPIVSMPAVIRRVAYHGVQGFVVNSENTYQKVLNKQKLSARKVHLVLNGVKVEDAQASKPDLIEYGIAPEHLVVATVGTIKRVKNQRMFITCIKLLQSYFGSVHGVIVGQPVPSSTEELDYLKTMIVDLNLSKVVHLIGLRKDVPQLMHRFAVVCHTSYFEGTPNVVLEAMAAARPVVATCVGALPYIIEDGQNGFLVDVDNPEQMARIVQRLLEDPSLATRVGAAAQETVRTRFGCAHMARKTEAMFIEALELAGSPQTRIL